MMVISPDEGALATSITWRSAMGVDMGMFYKRRDYTRVVNGRNPDRRSRSIWATAWRARVFVPTTSSLPANPSSIWRIIGGAKAKRERVRGRDVRVSFTQRPGGV